jgi:glutathione S-transferase
VVPTLVHDGVPMINSFCINEYIDDAFPEPPLRPADLHERARSRYWAWTADEIHLQLARLTHARMLQQSVNELSTADKDTMLRHTPVPEKRDRWRLLTKGGYSEEQLDTALENVMFVFARMDEELGKRGPWLAGKTYSLGDIGMLAIVHRIGELFPDRLDRTRFPRTMDWWDRSMARPAAKFAYANGTDETPPRPKTKSVAGIAEFRV